VAQTLDRLGLISLGQERLRKSDHLNPLADIADFRRVAAEAGFSVARIRYYTPLVGGIIENLLVRLVEGLLTRRAARGVEARSTPGEAASLRDVRLKAKERIARRGASYVMLRVLTWLMKLDILLFSRVETGPFFALLIRQEFSIPNSQF
jgi:hypothetical protein